MALTPDRLLGAALGLVADRLIGEPPTGFHPVAGFGRLMTWVESLLYADHRAAGVAHVVTGVSVGTLSGGMLNRVAGRYNGWSPPGSADLPDLMPAAVASWISIAGRNLAETALGIGDHLEAGRLDEARAALPALVGRDPSGLDEKEASRAVIESVAENTVDGVVAPALWAAAGGSAGTLAYRAINTMDSMVGHRSPRYERFGWAAARLDDAANLLPARLTPLLVAGVRPRAAADVFRVVSRDARRHPSPNAGYGEAAFAAALGLRLGGANQYDSGMEIRGPLGHGRGPEPRDIRPAVALSLDAGSLLLALLGAAGAAAALVGRRGRKEGP